MSREFGLCINGSGYGLAIEHLGTFENFKGILLLAEKQAMCVGCDVDAKEVMKLSKVGHGKLTFERGNDVMESTGSACGEYDVINVHK